MANRKLMHFIALTRNETWVDLFYYTKEEAIARNPGLTNFCLVGGPNVSDNKKIWKKTEKWKAVI